MYQIILDSDVDPGSPITHSLMRRLRDNPYDLVAGLVAVDGGVTPVAQDQIALAASINWPSDIGSRTLENEYYRKIISATGGPGGSASYPVFPRRIMSCALPLSIGFDYSAGGYYFGTVPLRFGIVYSGGVATHLKVFLLDNTREFYFYPLTRPTWVWDPGGYDVAFSGPLFAGTVMVPIAGGTVSLFTMVDGGHTMTVTASASASAEAYVITLTAVKSNNAMNGIAFVQQQSLNSEAFGTQVMIGLP